MPNLFADALNKLKANLNNKGSTIVTKFLQTVKVQADELALLGAPVDAEDLTEKILDRLDDEYKELVRAVQARDISITFEELYKK